MNKIQKQLSWEYDNCYSIYLFISKILGLKSDTNCSCSMVRLVTALIKENANEHGR